MLALLCVLLSPCALPQQKDTSGNPNDDPVLQAMREEIERSKNYLKLDHVAAPYYIEYRIFDVDDYTAEASFGALRSQLRSRSRILHVSVRVGDYRQDGVSGQGERTLNVGDLMPVDNDTIALRHQLWLATDRAFKEAAEALAAKQAQLKQFTIDQPVDDFARAEPVHSVGPLVRLDIDPQSFNRMLEDASAVFKTDSQTQASDSNLRFQAMNRYLANSEGTAVRDGRLLYQMFLSCSTQAGDGMSLQRSQGFVTEKVTELPSAAAFVGRASDMMKSLQSLRAAPLVEEEYRGPVLFSADASTTIFAQLIGDNVLGNRPELGKTTRTTGPFATSYKSRVLPEFLSVVDDPTISTYRGHSLLGHYEVDDEGVPAQRVQVIENGTLKNYLIGREPIRDFPASNGHARARLPGPLPGLTHPLPHTGNLIVSASQTLTGEQIRNRFMELCRQRDLPYCYRVETFGPKLAPRLLYKVWTKDGHEELVRGGSFGDLDVRSLRSSLIAAGDDVYIDDLPLNVPHSIAAPSVLFDDLEIKLATSDRGKLPEYSAPPLAGK